MTAKDGWNPNQYDKFKNERSQPFFDLVDLLQPTQAPRIVDLGCGTGELTKVLHERFASANTMGIDSSAEMLKKASAQIGDRLSFEIENIEQWSQPQAFDIVFSNAALQWCGNHRSLFAKIKSSLREGGQIAVQMPMNHDYPTHVLAGQMAQEEPWRSLLKEEKRDQQKTMLTVEEYAQLLFDLGFKEQKVNLRVYGHVLESREGVIEWVKGTLLTYYKSRLSDEHYQEFVSQFRKRLFEQLPDNKPFFYPFKRILLWGRI